MPIAEDIDAAIGAYDRRDTLSGAIRISNAGKPVFERAFGQASRQLGVANTLATRFHIASMTKMLIAAAVVRLVGEGALSLAAHPAVYLPALKALDRRITLHHLLSHTSGVADVYDNDALRAEMAGLVARGGSFREYLVALPQTFPPGDRWAYSTTGFLLLAFVLEAVAGAPFGQVIGEMFLTPLGMENTGPDDPYRVNPGRALGHVSTSDGWRNAQNDRLVEVDGPREFYSTVGDLDRWAVALLDGKVLNEAGRAMSFTAHAHIGPDSGFDPSWNYGYGWFLGEDYRFIGGMTEGFVSAMWQYPDERLSVTMLWNNESVNSFRLLGALRPLLRA
jgi:CubicO group peptidase (beta-lactamase class C family)